MMRSVLLIFFLFTVVHCSCPDGFDLVRDGQCRQAQLKPTVLKAVRHEATSTAISQCATVQSQPITIHTKEQESYWLGKYKQHYSNSQHYIVLGLTCNATSSKWVWADGSANDYKPSSADLALELPCKSGCAWYMDIDTTWIIDCSNRTDDNNFDIYCTQQIPKPDGGGCDSYEVDNDDGVCYKVTNAKNFNDGQTVCKNAGGQVASVHSKQANSFLRRLAVSGGAVNGLYLGATISEKGNEWVDGTTWDYDNFHPGFPVAGFGECVVMDTGDTSGEWVNADCNSSNAVACMRPLQYESTSCPSGALTEGQTAYSPGYPYDASVPCDFVLSVDADHRVGLNIVVLEANSCCDRLIVYENYFGSNVIANLTGAMENQFITTTSSNSMRVSWQPQGGVNVRGVEMTFRAV